MSKRAEELYEVIDNKARAFTHYDCRLPSDCFTKGQIIALIDAELRKERERAAKRADRTIRDQIKASIDPRSPVGRKGLSAAILAEEEA